MPLRTLDATENLRFHAYENKLSLGAKRSWTILEIFNIKKKYANLNDSEETRIIIYLFLLLNFIFKKTYIFYNAYKKTVIKLSSQKICFNFIYIHFVRWSI